MPQRTPDLLSAALAGPRPLTLTRTVPRLIWESEADWTAKELCSLGESGTSRGSP